MPSRQARTDNGNDASPSAKWRFAVSTRAAFLMVSLSLGQLGDGLNIFQGIYLVGMGWNEGSVGTALSLMGLTALLVQPLAGDWVDKATIDRRIFLTAASVVTALSASTILLVRRGNSDHALIYASKILEGIASSFIGPCLAALTLASFGPDEFDGVMASNILWGHVGSVAAAGLAGLVAYVCYPDIKFCFLIIGASALVAIAFIQCLPQGDPLLARGFRRESEGSDDATVTTERQLSMSVHSDTETESSVLISPQASRSEDEDEDEDEGPKAASYLEVFLDYKTCVLCFTGFFFHFANANVLLVLGEMMGGGNKDADGDDDTQARTAIPLTAGAIIMAQVTMALATYVGDRCTAMGTGRKVLFMAGIASLPVRCALIILLRDAGDAYLLSTQILDGIGGGLMGLILPYIVADITFGTGRFNAVNGLTASFFGLGATLSNYLGQMVVEHFGHVASLTGSLVLSIIPIFLFSRMPETYGCRGGGGAQAAAEKKAPASEAPGPAENNGGVKSYQTGVELSV